MAVGLVAGKDAIDRGSQVLLRARTCLHDDQTCCRVRHENIDQPIAVSLAEGNDLAGQVNEPPVRGVYVDFPGLHSAILGAQPGDRRAGLLGRYADVGGAHARRVARVSLKLKLDGLAFLQVIKDATCQRSRVEKDVLVRVVRLDESKSSISNEAGDLTCWQCCFPSSSAQSTPKPFSSPCGSTQSTGLKNVGELLGKPTACGS